MADAATMLDLLCERPLIEKTRYCQSFGGKTWEIDVFHGDNAGLVVAEFEASLKKYPPIKLGTPDPYTPPEPTR